MASNKVIINSEANSVVISEPVEGSRIVKVIAAGPQGARGEGFNSVSSSLNERIDVLETFSSSLDATFATDAQLTTFSSSLSSSITSLSGSVNNRILTLSSSLSSSIMSLSQSVDNRLDSIEAVYATTGSNTFVGNQIISGSLKTNETQISLGFRAGNSNQGYGAIAIGANAATSSQGQNAVAIGIEAGEQSQGIYSVALGNGAGKIQQGQSSVSIGGSAGVQNQSSHAVAIGDRAGAYQQGSGSIAIGHKAGEFYQPNNTIIIDANGGGAAFGLTQTGSFYVSPIRNANGIDGVLQYNATTKEVTYSDEYATTGSNTFIGNQIISGNLNVDGTITAEKLQITYVTSSILYQSGSTKFGDSSDDTHQFTGSLTISGSISASSFIGLGNLATYSSSIDDRLNSLSASSGYIQYVTNSIENLTGIEVADFDSNIAVTFTDGTLKFIFGTPTLPSSIAASLSGFLSDRFNKVTDDYTINGNWNNGGYSLVSASLYEGTSLLTQVGSGTSLSHSVTTSGSHTYRLEYTASSPLDQSIYQTSTTTTGTVSKSNPASPTLTVTPNVQLGYSSNQIEQGATGSISFTSSSANPSNSWNLTSVTTNVSSPYYVTGSLTGSTSISITATANYASPIGDNSPDLTTTSTSTTTYTKIRSLRYGASSNSSFTSAELENLAAWDTSIGGTIGTIAKGTTTASGQSVTITWTGDKYHYIVFNSSLSNLSNITTSGFGVLGSFSVSTVGQYKVYRSTTLQAGGAGSSITYALT